MSDDSQRNSAFNAAASSKVYHAHIQDLPLSTVRKLYKGGIRPGEPMRTRTQAGEMLNKVPPSQRAGVDAGSASANTQKYLSDKHASHIKPHSQGGSNDPSNIRWENGRDNMARGGKAMTRQEQVRLDAKWHFDNLAGAIKAGIEAAPKGAAIGAVTTAPFSLLRNALCVVRGEISAQEAATETVKEIAVGGAVGGVSAFAVTAVAAACPPVAIALTALSPVLLAAGGAGMVYEFFKILDDHKQTVKEYYESLTQQQLEHLQKIEDELLYEHAKNFKFLDESKALNDEISNRPRELGIEGALRRYLESAAIAKSLGATPVGNKLQLLPAFKHSLLPADC